ncbi:TetR/AcrR family transcriptional regulator [Brevibacillus humidisoli]|uniref:TetR/AcrR family transcriptional regulator n=1 Tax=Brevibacillus humidisoli TaxID=2895522 RepID=UPI001E653172|nr:TetR/AcrR family transcriptional regulator [Brevibacillus humidisoli]UFJ39520.1 TetR/AcrR family transcriptional regulator [Brevibacillus humidisoli]
MARGFNEREKEIIRTKLIQQGREFFGSRGVKKTSVADLTQAVGIAQGSFYLFFSSKEELFFEIMEREEQKMKEQLLQEVLVEPTISKSFFKRFLLTAMQMVHNNPIIRQIYLEDQYEAILRKLPLERMEAHIQNDTDVLRPLIEAWQQRGMMIRQDSAVIGGVIRSFFTLALHKREIGEEVYEQTLDLLAELIANGLVIERREQHD